MSIKIGYSVRRVIIMPSMKLLYGSCASSYCVLLVWLMWIGSVIVVLFSEEFNMNKQQIAAEIKKTEEQLSKLGAELEKPEYPTLADSIPGDMLENGCVVVHKFSDTRMALIAATEGPEMYCPWNKEFEIVFDELSRKGFNKSQWFIPNVKQLQLAYKNCKEHFASAHYWSSTEASSTNSCNVSFFFGYQSTLSKTLTNCVRAFSLVSY